MCSGEVPFRKAYLSAILDRVEMYDGVIRIIGQKDVLEEAVMHEGGPCPGFAVFVQLAEWGSAKKCYVSTHNQVNFDQPI
jgi:hypothetical protein